MTTSVIHIRDNKPGDVFIGRPGPWGNPFTIGKDGTRDEVCNKHAQWLKHSLDPRAVWCREHIDDLRGKRLVCYCKPLRCHGDTFVSWGLEE